MNTRIISLYKISLIIGLSLMIVGLIFSIQHLPCEKAIFIISQITSLPYILIGLIDVYKSASMLVIEKILWTIGFIGLSWIVGLSYYWIELDCKRNKIS